MILPIVMTLALAIAEFGFAFGTNMTMIEATREAARVGAVLGTGSRSFGCPGFPGAANVDPQIIAAVQRVVEAPGSGIDPKLIDWIHIYDYSTPGTYNEWKYKDSTHAGVPVCGVTLDFYQASAPWAPASRTAALPVHSLAVAIQYRYKLFTPLSALTGLFGAGQITMVDSTVMDIEP